MISCFTVNLLVALHAIYNCHLLHQWLKDNFVCIRSIACKRCASAVFEMFWKNLLFSVHLWKYCMWILWVFVLDFFFFFLHHASTYDLQRKKKKWWVSFLPLGFSPLSQQGVSYIVQWSDSRVRWRRLWEEHRQLHPLLLHGTGPALLPWTPWCCQVLRLCPR